MGIKLEKASISTWYSVSMEYVIATVVILLSFNLMSTQMIQI